MKLTVAGKLEGRSVAVSWEDGGLNGDILLIRKMLDIAVDKLYLDLPVPIGLTPIELSNPETFVPLAKMALDETTEVTGLPKDNNPPGTVY